jgi:hypothetical protein
MFASKEFAKNKKKYFYNKINNLNWWQSWMFVIARAALLPLPYLPAVTGVALLHVDFNPTLVHLYAQA